MNSNKKVSIIIPAYKAQNVLPRALHSIASQTMAPDIEVVVVNDCCPNGNYQAIIKDFAKWLDIKEIRLDKNGGPGVARQAGIDATSAPFFTCMDADDTLNGAFAIEQLYGLITREPINVCLSGTFLEVHEGMNFVPHNADMVWMFGKMYRRSFINKYKIRFNETRANEDTGFNTKVRLICGDVNNKQEQLLFSDYPVYYWHEKVDSITRVNNCQYSFDQSFCGWTDNMIDAAKFVKQAMPFNTEVDKFIVESMLHLYTYYIETVVKAPVFAPQNWEYVKKFFNECYREIDSKITPQIFGEMYSFHMKAGYEKGSLLGFTLPIGIDEFMNKLRTEPYNPDDIYKVWSEMPEDLKRNNVNCGVCPEGYDKKEKIECSQDLTK